jgi:hypothetical protein
MTTERIYETKEAEPIEDPSIRGWIRLSMLQAQKSKYRVTSVECRMSKEGVFLISIDSKD